MNKEEMQKEALHRAETGISPANYDLIFEGFMGKGIPEEDILPRENIFTFNAWKAKGRVVRRGEHGVKVYTFIKVEDKETDRKRTLQKSTTVFHISQTDPIQGHKGDEEE